MRQAGLLAETLNETGRPVMPSYEIAILPCLPLYQTVEDDRLEASAPAFGLAHAMPNVALARTLSFLNVSKVHFLDLIEERGHIRPTDRRPHGEGPWRHRHELAPAWRALQVKADENRPQLLSDSQMIELFDNATYGGHLAIAGKVHGDFCLPALPYDALTIRGRFQIGIIDYLWGSGHSVTFDGSVTVDMRGGQAGPAPGIPFDDVCSFAADWFRIDMVARATLPRGMRWRAEPRAVGQVAA